MLALRGTRRADERYGYFGSVETGMTTHTTRAALRRGAWAMPLLAGLVAPAAAEYRPVTAETAVDLSPTVSMSHKQYYPGGRHHQPVIVNYITPGPGPLAADLLLVDENTATQLDCPRT
jgi:hypothetical protein